MNEKHSFAAFFGVPVEYNSLERELYNRLHQLNYALCIMNYELCIMH